MHARDPDRPRQANGWPCYMDLSGKPIAALQSLIISTNLSDKGGYDVGVWLLENATEASCYHTRLLTGQEVGQLIMDYAENPEDVLRQVFSYKGPSAPAAKPPPPDMAQVDSILRDLNLI